MTTPATTTKTLDPVCGMTVDPATAINAKHNGKTYYFCCEKCRTAFKAKPTSASDAGAGGCCG